MSDAIKVGDAVWNVRADTSGLENGLKAATDGVKGAMDSIKAHARTVGVAFGVIGGAITAAIGVAAHSIMDYSGTILDASQKTGIATDALQKLKFGAEQSGLNFEGLQDAIIRMNNALGEAARTGKGPMVDALAAVGLTIQSFQGLTPDQQFIKLAEALSHVPDPALKTSLAMDIFGKSGAQLIPLLDGGAAGIEELGRQAEVLGIVLDGGVIESAEALGDQWDAMKLQLQGIALQIGAALIPVLQQMLPVIQQVLAGVLGWIQANPELTGTITMIVGAIGTILVALSPLLIALPGLIAAFSAIGPVVAAVGAGLVALTGPIGLVVLALGAIVAAGWYVYNHWEEFKAGAEIIWGGIVDFLKSTWDMITATFVLGVRIVMAPAQQLFQVLTAGWETLKSVTSAVIGVFQSAWGGLVAVFDWVLEKVRGFWEMIKGMFSGGVEMIVHALSFLSGLFGDGAVPTAPDFPARAGGGPVQKGMAYTVGEVGRELFIPHENGQILPNKALERLLSGGLMGGAGNIEINVNGVNRDPRSVAREISRELSVSIMAGARA